MQCPRCQSESPPDATFCPECGARLEIACPSCGTANAPIHKFCKRCGQPLTSTAPGTRFAFPQAYTPPHLAEKILSSKSALEGERKQVTVLFADLKGSMELLADRDPEEARKLLDPVLERMMEAVHRYEGTVNQVMGDGIMALFGAPVAHEDHAVRACYAALRMQESVSRYGDEIQRAHGVPVQIRVGLNSGEVVVRSIGSDLRMDYTAVGQTTHLAARMEQMARPGSVLVTAVTLRLAEGYIHVKPLGPVVVKGLEAPIDVYEVAGAGPARSRLQVGAAQGLSPFVGRDGELEQLQRALEQAEKGHGQVVALVGEPGVGKSRLFWEFAHSYRTDGWLLLQGAAVSYGKATAYSPVLDLLKGYFKIEDRDDSRTIQEKVTGRVMTLDPSLEDAVLAVLALLEALPQEHPFRTITPAQRRRRTLDALRRLLLRESQVQPMLLVVEDLHWIDSETQALLDSLTESLPAARVLLLVNYRPEYQHGWGTKGYYTQLRIDPLPPDSCEALLHALVGNGADVQPLKRLLIERTEGNPFFLEESVRTLVETRVLVGERGAYRMAMAPSGIQVPATVQAVLAARIDRLPPEEKGLLQTAAVIGKDVPIAILQAVAGLPEDALRPGLAHLQAAEFLYEAHLFPEVEYTFKHALTHDVAYGSLLQERRRGLHARIVEAIEALYADGLAERVEQLSYHAHRGEAWDKALTYLRQAGAKAVARSADREAVAWFEQALDTLTHLPDSRDRLQQAIDLRFSLRASLFRLGEFGRILDHLREAETLARTIDDHPRLGQVYSHLINYYLATAEHDRALESGRRALAIANDLNDVNLQLVTHFHLGQVYASLGEYRRAVASIRTFVQSLRSDPRRQGFDQSARLVLSSTWLAWWLAELGEFAEGTTIGEETVRVAEAVDQPFERLVAYLGMGLLHLRKGDFHKAIPALERSLPLCRIGDLVLWSPAIASPLGYAYALSGRLAEAIPLLERAVQETMLLRRVGHALRMAHLSEAFLLAGRPDDAARLAAQALDLCRQHKERGHQAYVLRLLGEIASHHDSPQIEEAEDAYRQARALAEELGMRPLLAHCHLGLGGLYARLGRAEAARAALSNAIRLFGSMEMAFWLDRAEAALAKVGGAP